MVRREKQRASLLVARPGGCDVARWFGSAAMIDELHNSSILPHIKIPCIAWRIAANFGRIFHRNQFRRAISNRQFLVFFNGYIGAAVPVGMEREEKPIVIVDEARLNLVLHVGRCAAELRTVIRNFNGLAVLVGCFVGDVASLGLPSP